MAQQPPAVRSGKDTPAEAQGWKPIAPEHYNASLVPWVSAAGKAGMRWLEERTKPSADPGLLLITDQVYDLWKGHAVGAGGPFPVEVVKQRQVDTGSSYATPGDTPGWRATLVLGGLLIILAIVILYVVLTPR